MITGIGIVFFIIALSFYCSSTNFYICGDATRQSSNIHVSITLVLAVALGEVLLVILSAGVHGGNLIIAVCVAICVEQVGLLIVFLTSKKIRPNFRKCFERKEPEI